MFGSLLMSFDPLLFLTMQEEPLIHPLFISFFALLCFVLFFSVAVF